jgi:anti-anti-sigma factor
MMPAPAPYRVTSCESTVYVCAAGLCSMKNAPMLDGFLSESRDGGVRHAYIDLAAVTGMDSTFMGMLVGHALAFQEADGRLVIVRPSEKGRQLLELLGIAEIVRVVDAVPCPEATFVELRCGTELSQTQRLDLIRRAHVSLSSLNDGNRATFAPFLAALEADIHRVAH